MGSEERAQSEAIAQSLATFAEVPVPIVATVIGEGGSGGALALALADHVIMLQHAVYSVASPEGAAAILWGDAAKAEEAASRLRLTSDDLRELRHRRRDRARAAGRSAPRCAGTIAACHRPPSTPRWASCELPPVHTLLDRRYAKFRRIGAVA